MAFEQLNVAAFSYSTVVGSPGTVFDEIQVWASINGILHKRERGGKYRVLEICHTSLGCKYVFEDEALSGSWLSNYKSALNAVVVTIGAVAAEAFISCVAGAIAGSVAATPAAAVPGCVAGVVAAYPAIVITGVAGLISAAAIYIAADIDIHNQWNQVTDIRPVKPWRKNLSLQMECLPNQLTTHRYNDNIGARLDSV